MAKDKIREERGYNNMLVSGAEMGRAAHRLGEDSQLLACCSCGWFLMPTERLPLSSGCTARGDDWDGRPAG